MSGKCNSRNGKVIPYSKTFIKFRSAALKTLSDCNRT